MPNLLAGWIMELARRREFAAAAVLLLAGGLIWMAVHEPTPAIQENSLEAMRFGDLNGDTVDAGRASGLKQTTRRISPPDDSDVDPGPEPTMSAWMLSNAPLDLEGKFVPPPIQVAQSRSAVPAPQYNFAPAADVPPKRVIQQLQMQDDPAVPRARLTGVSLDGEQTAQ